MLPAVHRTQPAAVVLCKWVGALMCVLAVTGTGTLALASASRGARHRHRALTRMFDEGMRRRRAKNGEEACEDQGFGQSKCMQVGCCGFEDGKCWSTVGRKTCDGDDNGNNGGGSDGDMIGGCILKEPTGAVPPTGAYTVAVQKSGVGIPFTKKVTAFGYVFVGVYMFMVVGIGARVGFWVLRHTHTPNVSSQCACVVKLKKGTRRFAWFCLPFHGTAGSGSSRVHQTP